MKNLDNVAYGCVYKTTNILNGKMYIGQSVFVKDVLNGRYKGSGKYLRNSINTHGWENFKSEIICYVDNQQELDEKEEFYIEKYNTIAPDGYNLVKGGKGLKGFKHSEDTKSLFSQQKTGENHPLYGTKRPDSVKDSISKANKGRLVKDKNPNYGKTGEKNHNFGKKRSDDFKKKISKSLKGRIPHNKGKKLSEKEKEKFNGENNHFFGKTHSMSSKLNISNSIKNLPPLKCPHCELESISRANMKRYHFDNCKKKN